MVTGRKPFEHASPDAAVIQRVLGGIRPDRPAMGFSDELWALLGQTWLEVSESSDSQAIRPEIAEIIKQLQGEVGNWSPADRVLSPTIQMEPEESCVFSVSSQLAHAWLTRYSQQMTLPNFLGFRTDLWGIRVRFPS